MLPNDYLSKLEAEIKIKGEEWFIWLRKYFVSLFRY